MMLVELAGGEDKKLYPARPLKETTKRHYFRTDHRIPLYHIVIFLGVTRNLFHPPK